MIIYENINENKKYIYIHIPKNGGRFIRNLIKNDTNNKIHRVLWGNTRKEDLAHMPFMKHINFINNIKKCKNIQCEFDVQIDELFGEYCCIMCKKNKKHGPCCERVKKKYTDYSDYTYYSYTRNPYDRVISAFFYLNPTKNNLDFKQFCKTKLIQCDFNLSFDKKYIHYYPQYLFLCDENLNEAKIKVEKLEEKFIPTKYDLKQFYDNECISIINKIYEKDFILFKYDFVHQI